MAHQNRILPHFDVHAMLSGRKKTGIPPGDEWVFPGDVGGRVGECWERGFEV